MSSSRKRGVPETGNVQNTINYAAPAMPQNLGLPNDGVAPDWSGTYTDSLNGMPSLGYDPMSFGYNGLPVDGQMAEYNPPPTTAGQLIRRNNANQLSRQDELPWEIEEHNGEDDEEEDEEDEASLERRAQEAKKEALAKKRQIPPFVQKISSFLEQSRNTDLIRWSGDGRSFIVLDEDEFAKTLIPELFKHNNYASFVRQLNMYGFHKKVGLGDNSMKASETKRKTPSEYANPYFRRGKPDLLWLIQKPKATAGGKAADAKAEDEEEETTSKKRAASANQLQRKRGGSSNSSKDLVSVTQSDLDTMRQEIIGLKQQNRVISEVITNMKKQNLAIHQQAIQFQQAQERFQLMHERHENSINAILTFLATFYNRSLEGQGGQSIANMIAQTLGQGNNQSGNIVDMTDLPDMGLDMRNLPNRSGTPRQRRAPLLLPAPPSSQTASEPASRFQNVDTPPPQSLNGQNSTIPTSDVPDIMSLINAANTNSPSGAGANALDFDGALNHIQNADGNVPLTDAQRSDVLQRMTDDANTALGADAKPIASTALTPTSGSPVNIPSPNIENILTHQDSLDYVQKLQEEQAKRVQNLAEKLGPLSPNGSVPGLHDDNSPLPENWNLDDWLNNNEYFQNDASNDGTGTSGFDINNDELFAPNHAASAAANGSSQAIGSPPAASPATVEEVEDADLSTNGNNNPRKRRRRD